MEKHGYVKLIEFALENSHFSMEQACTAAKISYSDFDYIRRDIFILNKEQIAEEFTHSSLSQEWKLNPKAYFNYLQYCEYKHAIETAKKANILSITAIVISGLLAIGSIVASFVG